MQRDWEEGYEESCEGEATSEKNPKVCPYCATTYTFSKNIEKCGEVAFDLNI